MKRSFEQFIGNNNDGHLLKSKKRRLLENLIEFNNLPLNEQSKLLKMQSSNATNYKWSEELKKVGDVISIIISFYISGIDIYRDCDINGKLLVKRETVSHFNAISLVCKEFRTIAFSRIYDILSLIIKFKYILQPNIDDSPRLIVSKEDPNNSSSDKKKIIGCFIYEDGPKIIALQSYKSEETKKSNSNGAYVIDSYYNIPDWYVRVMAMRLLEITSKYIDNNKDKCKKLKPKEVSKCDKRNGFDEYVTQKRKSTKLYADLFSFVIKNSSTNNNGNNTGQRRFTVSVDLVHKTIVAKYKGRNNFIIGNIMFNSPEIIIEKPEYFDYNENDNHMEIKMDSSDNI